MTTNAFSSLSKEWQATIVASAILVTLVIGVYYPTAAEMVGIWWRSDTFAHGFLIVPISGYLIWRQWEHIEKLKPQATWWGVPAIALASLLWWVAEISGTAVIAQFAFTALIPLVILTLVGVNISARLWFPLAYLLFAVPAGEGLIQPMMDFTAVFTVKAIELTGIPVYWEGRYIAIPKGNFEVAEACSGVRYLIASVALGALYAHLTYRSLWRQALFLFMAALVPIIANGIRAYGIVMIAHLSDMKLAVGADHLIYGWLFFGLVMFILFGIGSIWQEDVDGATESDIRGAKGSGGVSLAIMAPVLLVTALAGPALHYLNGDPTTDSAVALAEVQVDQRWQVTAETAINWGPRFIGNADERRMTFQKNGQNVDVYLAVYGHQRQGAELLNFGNRFFDPDTWLRLGEQPVQIETDTGALDWNEIHVQRRRARGMIWHVYEIAGIQTTNPAVAKLLEAWNRLVVNRPSRVLAVYADYDLREDEGRDTLRAFLSDNYAALNAAFDTAEKAMAR